MASGMLLSDKDELNCYHWEMNPHIPMLTGHCTMITIRPEWILNYTPSEETNAKIAYTSDY